MVTDRQRQIQSIYESALKRDRADRESFLDGACLGDPGLREAVESLLLSGGERGTDLKQPALDTAAVTWQRSGEVVSAGKQQVGPYRIIQEIGHGGMGVVYEAEQEKPVRRKVALKLIKWGMDTKEVITRFDSERQALALMNHPNIAAVYDAGATGQGRPYFAMELVHGEPIVEYCDKNRLTIRERLDLFIQACEGVQHAHQKGIIHRDIKPSNILVTIQDDKPVPKIIDFGVAKATSQRLTERTVYTELGQLIGTPEYMSPEQAEMTGLDIDTRTDVYSLGVVLYELLVGAQPFEAKTLRQVSFDKMRQRIREEEPPKPSERLSHLGEPSATAATNRRVELRSLERELRGDLDWITMKAIDKDRTRRYNSPFELAADIERYLTHQAVLAGPPSAAYQLRKFIRRHRLGVAVASAALLVLIGFAGLMTVQAERIARERDRANRAAAAKTQVADFLKDLFEVADPSEARGNSITAREILDKGVKKIDESLGDQPQLRAELLLAMGAVYTNLGLYREAESLLRRALDLQRRSLGADDATTLATVHELAWALSVQGQYDQAAALYREAFENRRALLGSRNPETLSSQGQLADTYAELGRHKESEALFLEVLDVQRDLLGGHHPETLITMNNLAGLYRRQQRYDEAVTLDQKVLEIRLRDLGEDHPHTLASLNNLAVGYQDQGRYDEARPVIERAIRIAERVWGVEHPSYGILVHTLGELHLAMRHFDEAERHLRRALTIYELQPAHAYTGLLLYQLAQASARQDDAAQALEFLSRALDAGYVHEGSPLGFADDSNLSPLHGHPKFEALVAEARTRVAH